LKHQGSWSPGAAPSKMILKKRKRIKRTMMHSLWILMIVIRCCLLILSFCKMHAVYYLFQIVSCLTVRIYFRKIGKIMRVFFSFYVS
jgi:hypothetical protein